MDFDEDIERLIRYVLVTLDCTDTSRRLEFTRLSLSQVEEQRGLIRSITEMSSEVKGYSVSSEFALEIAKEVWRRAQLL